MPENLNPDDPMKRYIEESELNENAKRIGVEAYIELIMKALHIDIPEDTRIQITEGLRALMLPPRAPMPVVYAYPSPNFRQTHADGGVDVWCFPALLERCTNFLFKPACDGGAAFVNFFDGNEDVFAIYGEVAENFMKWYDAIGRPPQIGSPYGTDSTNV